MNEAKLDPLIVALRDRREKLGVPLRVVSNRAGYPQNTMWHWETGRATPSLRKLNDWAEALDMRIELVKRQK